MKPSHYVESPTIEATVSATVPIGLGRAGASPDDCLYADAHERST
jgi:hypothetical protein